MAEVKESPKAKTEARNGHSQSKVIERRPSATVPVAGNPFTFMSRFSDEMDRLFEDFGLRLPGFVGRGRELLRRETGVIPAEWSPRVDIHERAGQFVVHADLPGLSNKDLHVEVGDDRITIQGERKQEEKEEREGYSYSECSYGRFYRAIPLPEGVDTSKAAASFRNGVLEIAMPAPQPQEQATRRLDVQEKK